MSEKIYLGHRGEDGSLEVEVFDRDRKIIQPLRHVGIHSPDGFEWGYGGSGPADLALSILADLFDEALPLYVNASRAWEKTEWRDQVTDWKAWRYHQEFKWKFVGRLGHFDWRLSSLSILDWLGIRSLWPGPSRMD